MVDDDPEDVFVIKRTLSHSDFDIKFDSFVSGSDFLKYLESGQSDPPNLVLIDINMPKMDGLQLLSVLRSDARWSRIKTVVLSTSNIHSDKAAALSSGAIDFFTKPTTMAELQDWRTKIEDILHTN